MKKTLHLTLKKQWFDMILSGEKKEEYREIKWFWVSRLITHYYGDVVMFDHQLRSALFDGKTSELELNKICIFFKHFDTIRFTNGYGKNAPSFEIECKGLRIGEGNPAWGGSGTTFILSLGNIIIKSIEQ